MEPRPTRISPRTRGGSHFDFTDSSPRRATNPPTEYCNTGGNASYLASSSIAIPAVTASASWPPYCLGKGRPIKPIWPIFLRSSQGYSPLFSNSRILEAISFLANSRTVLRKSSCSSLNAKSKTHPLQPYCRHCEDIRAILL